MPRDKAKNNEYMRKYMADRYARRRASALQALGGRCVDCGSKDDLELDHADPCSKSFEIAKRLAGCAEARLQEELKKITLRCSSCHSLKSVVERGDRPVRNRNVHGTLSSYRYCKCTACREAKAEYMRKYNSGGDVLGDT